MHNPNDLDIFCKVANTGNMTRVAESEGKTVMAISKQIARLEHALKQALFIRSRRKLQLTEYGAAFKQKASELVIQHKQFEEWATAQESIVSGQLNVICQANDVITETIVPWLSEFTSLYPELNIALDVKESLIDIRHDDYDVFWAVGSYLGDRYPGLKRRSLWRAQYGVFASPHYLSKHGTPTSPEQLSDHLVVGYLYNQPSNVLVLQDQKGEPIYALPKCQITTVAGMIDLAEAGLGLVNAPVDAKQVKQALANKQLSPVLEDYWWQDAEVFAYYHPSNPIQKKVRVFLDFFFDKRKHWED
ncbi:MAG: LysR family transcriptional regulator [Kangiellaceae bacterium]|jgi:DNA-binding transcriptional LysR family regulator|nr:LysR family transcriptional regulator [Kangiellaceae bacterium]